MHDTLFEIRIILKKMDNIMKKSLVLCIVILLMGGSYLSAQDNLSNGKALNFPAKKYGISIGNSYEFTGIRINFADENVKIINGLNITFWLKMFKNKNAVVNGISVGVIPVAAVLNGISVGVMTFAGTIQPISLGLLYLGAKNYLNGLSISGLIVATDGNINGLSVSGLVTMAEEDKSVISGIAISGIVLGARKAINGLAIGGLAVLTGGDISGVASSLACIACGKNIQGIAVTGGLLHSEMFKGVAIAGYAKTHQMHGLSIALYNRTKELHGIQFGLMNYAENNPKGLRMLPFINLHLRKNQNSDK